MGSGLGVDEEDMGEALYRRGNTIGRSERHSS